MFRLKTDWFEKDAMPVWYDASAMPPKEECVMLRKYSLSTVLAAGVFAFMWLLAEGSNWAAAPLQNSALF